MVFLVPGDIAVRFTLDMNAEDTRHCSEFESLGSHRGGEFFISQV